MIARCRAKPLAKDLNLPFLQGRGIILPYPDVSDERKALLRETYELLDLVQLRQQINDLQVSLLASTPMN